MRYFLYLLFAFIISGCTITPPKRLDSNIYGVEISSDGQEESRSKVEIYLHDEGKAWASVRFNISFASTSGRTQEIYIKSDNVSEVRNAFQRLVSNDIPAGGITSRPTFKVDNGEITIFKLTTEQHIIVFGPNSIFEFPLSEVPKIIAILDRLEQAAKPIK